MSLEQIKIASKEQFTQEQQNSRNVSETTPKDLNNLIVQFAATLSPSPSAFIPVVQDDHGLFGWCSDGVREKVRADGGEPVFGWTIWEWPGVLLTAEFHTVWNNSGELIDITPKPKGEQQIIFVPDFSYPTDFDFDQRPVNRRMKSYVGRDKGIEVRAVKERLAGAQLQYEEKRAQKAGLSLDEWLLRKLPHDPLPDAIEQLISACNEHEAYFDTFGAYGAFTPDHKLIELIKRRVAAQKRLKSLL